MTLLLAHVTPQDAILVSLHDLIFLLATAVLAGLVIGVRLGRKGLRERVQSAIAHRPDTDA